MSKPLPLLSAPRPSSLQLPRRGHGRAAPFSVDQTQLARFTPAGKGNLWIISEGRSSVSGSK